MKEIYKENKKLKLSRKELQIIEYFLLNLGKVVEKDKLIKSIW
jgi:DNA-binding winged helix-turn-helix (wHTH) protein